MPSHTHQVLLPRERRQRLVVWQALHPEIPLQALLQSPPLAEAVGRLPDALMLQTRMPSPHETGSQHVFSSSSGLSRVTQNNVLSE